MTPRERLFALEQFGIKLGLDNITTLVGALDHPERRYFTVHVAGTNGKGSVTAMVERGLRAAGHRTGRYTSPHLVSIEERIAIDGDPIDAATFDAVTAQVLVRIDDLTRTGALPHAATFFEATTAIAFEIFKRRRVTTAVIEVGLGGRFDATNVVAPQVTAITSIDFDHERHLGRTLPEIAFEKAGIIKPNVPVIAGLMAEDAHQVVARVAQAQAAPLIDAVPTRSGVPVSLALNGRHQHANAAVAVEILRHCSFEQAPPGARPTHVPPVTRQHVLSALTDTQWPARLEWLRVPRLGDILIDAAHNPAGARALADYVRTTAERLPMVLGVMRDKDVDAIIRALAPAVSRFVATSVDSPRALPGPELAARIVACAPDIPCDSDDDVRAAVDAACKPGSRAMVAGSIFLVGPLRAHLLARGGMPVRYPSKASPFFLN